jgi:peptidoglycan hydrolase-like amidase
LPTFVLIRPAARLTKMTASSVKNGDESYGEYNRKKITEAVHEYRRRIPHSMEKRSIQAVFHSSSAVKTADSQEVWEFSLTSSYTRQCPEPETAVNVQREFCVIQSP